jgi:hydrogenase maturation protease
LAAFFQILIYGYGNPGRQDDGLGYAMVRKLEGWTSENGFSGIEFDSNYQLNIEDAEAISAKDLVIFVDASAEEIEDYILTDVTGETDVSFTTHAASPGYIVKLCSELFSKTPPVKLLHIKGYEWEFREGLSDQAENNLHKAFIFMKEYLLNLQTQISGLKP